MVAGKSRAGHGFSFVSLSLSPFITWDLIRDLPRKGGFVIACGPDLLFP